jgi:L-seryl-tRNA(Ser) seleniumtransferase
MGFDLVAFSGGKGLRGPQNAGLLLGRKDLIEAAGWNNSPNSDTPGRGLKVAKEQIVGMVAAVDWILAQNDEALQAEFRLRAERIAAYLKGVPTLTHEIFVPPVANAVPHLVLRYDSARAGKPPLEIARILREGTPAIELHPGTGRANAWAGLPDTQNAIVVGVWMLLPGEDMVVAQHLRKILV